MDRKEMVARLGRIVQAIGEVPAGFLGGYLRCPSCNGPVEVKNDEYDEFRRISWRCLGCGREDFTVV